jgi:hypothetical protein
LHEHAFYDVFVLSGAYVFSKREMGKAGERAERGGNLRKKEDGVGH